MVRYETQETLETSTGVRKPGRGLSSRSPREPLHISHQSIDDHSADLTVPFRPEAGTLFEDYGTASSPYSSISPSHGRGRTASSDRPRAMQDLVGERAASNDDIDIFEHRVSNVSLQILLRHPDVLGMYDNLTRCGRLLGIDVVLDDINYVTDHDAQGPGCALIDRAYSTVMSSSSSGAAAGNRSPSQQRRNCPFPLAITLVRTGIVLFTNRSIPYDVNAAPLLLEFVNLCNSYEAMCEAANDRQLGSIDGLGMARRMEQIAKSNASKFDALIEEGCRMYEWPASLRDYSFSAMQGRGVLGDFLAEYRAKYLDAFGDVMAPSFEICHRLAENSTN